MIESIFFDLDGTLVDSAPGVQRAVRMAWEAVRPDGPCPEVRPMMGPPIREIFHRALPQADGTVLSALQEHFRTAYDSVGWLETAVYLGVREALTALKAAGVRCLGATNKPALPTQRILEHCGLGIFFEAFFSPDSCTPAFSSKTEAAQTLIAQHGINRQSALFMGDTIEDLLVARACGLRFMAFRGGYGWAGLSSQPADFLICHRFEELPSLVVGG